MRGSSERLVCKAHATGRVTSVCLNSFVELWIAREGQPSELAIAWGPYNLSAGSPGANQKFGKVWLLPYNTRKDASVAYPETYTWYDELIISRTRIADPVTSSGGDPGDTTPPSPTGLQATPAPGQITLSWNASSDNVNLFVSCTRGDCHAYVYRHSGSPPP